MKTFRELLIQLDACQPGIDWMGYRTVEQYINEADRGDWMLWLAQKIDLSKKNITLTKGHCANTVRHLMSDERSTAAVDAAIAFGEGKISGKKLAQAAVAARAAAVEAQAVEAQAQAAEAEAPWKLAAVTRMVARTATVARMAARAAAVAAEVTAVTAEVTTVAAAVTRKAAWAEVTAVEAEAIWMAEKVAVTAVQAEAIWMAEKAAVTAVEKNKFLCTEICRKYLGKKIIKKINKLLKGE